MGGVEVFVYGAAGTGAVAGLYNVLPARANESLAMSCCATKPQRAEQDGKLRV